METALKVVTDEPDSMEQRINLLVQAQRSVDLYQSRVIEPFEEHARSIGGTAFKEGDLEIRVTSRTTQRRRSASRVVDKLVDFIKTTLANQTKGRQMYGVKSFGDAVAIDAGYLQEEFVGWEDAVIGETTSQPVSYKATKASATAGRELAQAHAGRLALVGHKPPSYDGALSRDEIALYVAACEQVAALKKRNGELENELKGMANPHKTRTTFDTIDEGEFSVQIKTVPRHQPDYKCIRAALGATLGQAANLEEGEVDNKTTFFNNNLAEPRAYISAQGLLSGIEEQKGVTERMQRQEVRVLYKPADAVVLVLD